VHGRFVTVNEPVNPGTLVVVVDDVDVVVVELVVVDVFGPPPQLAPARINTATTIE